LNHRRKADQKRGQFWEEKKCERSQPGGKGIYQQKKENVVAGNEQKVADRPEEDLWGGAAVKGWGEINLPMTNRE